jgi:hypothetical protein
MDEAQAWERFFELILYKAGLNVPVPVLIELANGRTQSVYIAGETLSVLPVLAQRLAAWAIEHQEQVIAGHPSGHRIVISGVEDLPQGLGFVLLQLAPHLIR